jgi:hypothetical protein
MVMECSCSCEFNDDAPPDFMSTRFPKASKPFKCCECDKLIEEGEIHEYIVGKWEGEVDSFRTCLPCSRIRRDYSECSPFGGLAEAIWECLGFNYITGEWRESHVPTSEG